MRWQAWVRGVLNRLPLRPLLGGVSGAVKRALWRRRRRAYRDARQDAAAWTSAPTLSVLAPTMARTGPRFLIVMNGGIGNAVEATPLVQALRAQFPQAHLTLWHPGGDLFDAWPVADRLVRSLEELAGEAFARTFVTFAANDEGLDERQRGNVSRIACLHDRWLVAPEREYNCALARDLGYAGPTPPLYVSTRTPAQPVLEAARRICIAPGGKLVFRWRNKRWPHFAALLEALRTRWPEAQLCVLGGPDDEPGLALPSTVLDLRGKLSLRETAWVLSRAALAIGNDCGPMHIADAVHCPSVVLFGPTCELKNGPRNRAIVLTREVSCRPCQYGELLMTCNDPICMKDLSPAEVLAAAERALGSPAEAHA